VLSCGARAGPCQAQRGQEGPLSRVGTRKDNTLTEVGSTVFTPRRTAWPAALAGGVLLLATATAHANVTLTS